MVRFPTGRPQGRSKAFHPRGTARSSRKPAWASCNPTSVLPVPGRPVIRTKWRLAVAAASLAISCSNSESAQFRIRPLDPRQIAGLHQLSGRFDERWHRTVGLGIEEATLGRSDREFQTHRRSAIRPSMASGPRTSTPAISPAARGPHEDQGWPHLAFFAVTVVGAQVARVGARLIDVGEFGTAFPLSSRTRTPSPSRKITSGRRCSIGSWYSRIAEYSRADGSGDRACPTSDWSGGIDSSQAAICSGETTSGSRSGTVGRKEPRPHETAERMSSSRDRPADTSSPTRLPGYWRLR